VKALFSHQDYVFYTAKTAAGEDIALTALVEISNKKLILHEVTMNYNAWRREVVNPALKVGARTIVQIIKKEMPAMARKEGFESITYKWHRSGFGSTANASLQRAVDLTIPL